MNIEGSRSFQNNFVQYSFRLSVLVPDFLIQLGIDLVYIAAKIIEIIFSVVIIQVGTLTFQFLKSKFLCWSNKAFLVFLSPHHPTTLKQTHHSNWALFLYKPLILGIGHDRVTIIVFHNAIIFSKFFTGRRSDQMNLFSFALCT